jgi:hypothetical protein
MSDNELRAAEATEAHGLVADDRQPWPRCECGRRFPSDWHLEQHRFRDACLGAREHEILIRRRRAA